MGIKTFLIGLQRLRRARKKFDIIGCNQRTQELMAIFNSQVKSPVRALKFANYGHFLNHVIMLVYPTIALTLSDLWSKPYGELLSAFFIGSLIYGFASYPAGWLSDR